MRKELGLDRPVVEQYFRYISDLLRGNLGTSIMAQRPVGTILLERFPATVELTLVALGFAVMVGLPLGIASARRKDKLLDHAGRFFSLAGVSVPEFWFGIVLLLVFQVKFHLVQGVGRIDPAVASAHPVMTITGLYLIDTIVTGNWPSFLSSLSHIALPAFALSLSTLARVARITRSSMIEVLQEEYITVARSKGLPERLVVFRHALKNALIPTVTIIGMSFGYNLGGDVLIESIFQWPGIGLFAFQAISNNDFPAVMGVVLLGTLVFLVSNLIVDLSYVVLDPRVRYG